MFEWDNLSRRVKILEEISLSTSSNDNLPSLGGPNDDVTLIKPIN